MDAIENQYERYTRQIPLPGFGRQAQDKLASAKVLVIGAGGLGSPVIQYLAAAGVGTLGIVDGDKVELSNLHRQLLFNTTDIGKSKSVVAAGKVNQINPGITCRSYPYHITNQNAFDLMAGYDIVVDCTDNFTARYLVSDACRLLDKPLVFAAVFQYEGQVAVFNTANAHNQKITYRDLFPDPPDASAIPDCNVAGVLGVLPGMIGMLQATEVIKIITGIGEVLAGKLLNYDIRTHRSLVIELSKLQADTGPGGREEFEKMDYDWLCGSGAIPGIDKHILAEMLAGIETIAIDVREVDETPEAGFPHQRIPLSLFDSLPEIPSFSNIIVFCQSGARSVKAAALLKKKFGTEKQVFHLIGGLTAYNRVEHE
jgi:molybdopterin/thiamine biosynthesis adenylyltransferase/rhodanese-related sulfurtransferase